MSYFIVHQELIEALAKRKRGKVYDQLEILLSITPIQFVPLNSAILPYVLNGLSVRVATRGGHTDPLSKDPNVTPNPNPKKASTRHRKKSKESP